MEAKFTKGDWKVVEYEYGCMVSIDGEERQDHAVCNISGFPFCNQSIKNRDRNQKTIMFNAKLIAAAPELFKESAELVERLSGVVDDAELEGLKQAIKKATSC